MLLFGDYLAITVSVLFGLLITALVLARPRWCQAAGYLLGLMLLCLHLLDALLDYLWVWLVPDPASTVLMLVAVWPALIAVLLGLIRHLPRRQDRRALLLLICVLGAYGVYALGSQLTDPHTSSDSWWNGEVLMQSTGSTCIAAAAATYLRMAGIECSEGEAAKRGLISGSGGTLTQAWRILRLSLPPATRMRIGPADKSVFADGAWRIVSVSHGPLTGHAIVVRANAEDSVQLLDPLVGAYEMQWNDFSADYGGVAVWAEL